MRHGPLNDADEQQPFRVGQLVDITDHDPPGRDTADQALLDPLTGAPNRALFLDQVQSSLDAGPADAHLVVLVLELDHFSRVNLSLGRAAGDQLLAAVARRLRTTSGDRDMVARLDGDHFAVACPGVADHQHAVTLAHAVSSALERPFLIGGHPIVLSASIGMASNVEAPSSAETLLRQAQVAARQAKAGGRGRIRAFEAAASTDLDAWLSLEHDLRRSIVREELTLHYQPIVSIPDARITAVEALLRWQHPERGLLLPGQFLQLAEQGDLIHPLGRWVIGQVLSDLAALRGRFGQDLQVAVNVSPIQLDRSGFVAQVRGQLRRAGVRSSALRIEVTESAVARDLDRSRSNLMQLRTLGVSLAIDDFGTGYSSLAQLGDVPIDVLKIDRAFVQRGPRSEAASAILTAIISMAHALGCTVTAEGVELPEQLRLLSSLGCDDVQGYLLARPSPIEELLATSTEAGSAGPGRWPAPEVWAGMRWARPGTDVGRAGGHPHEGTS